MKPTNKRYGLLLIAAILNFTFGSAYIWSVFQPAALTTFQLDVSSANLPFNVFMSLFVIGNITGGKLQQKIGIRPSIILGSYLMCAGLLGTAFVPVTLPQLLPVTFGILGGLGAGIAYNTLVMGIQKWFPDKRGMVTGVVVSAVGIPGLVISPLLNSWIHSYGFSKAFLYISIAYTIVCIALGWLITPPPEGYMADYVQSTNSVSTSKKQYRTGEMLRTKQYYYISAIMLFAATSYFLIGPMMKSLGVDRGLSEELALFGVMIASICNVLGRLSAPWVSDRVGIKPVLYTLFILTMAAVLTLVIAGGPLFIICIAMVNFCYGGLFGIFPIVVASYFGTTYAGMNYGTVMIGYGIISLVCPLIIKLGITPSFLFAGFACGIGMALTILVKPPKQ